MLVETIENGRLINISRTICLAYFYSLSHLYPFVFELFVEQVVF